MNIELYNKVFSNLYIRNEIFNYVREINRQIVNSNLKNQSFQQIVKYDQVTFEWIIRNKEYELLKDKIKNNIKFQEFTYQALISFTSDQVNYDKKLLKQFFKINRDKLVNSKYIDEQYREIDILTFSVYSQNSTLFNLVIDDLVNVQEYSKKKLKSSINSAFMATNLKISLFDIALEYGNLDIIKYLYEEIGILSLNIQKILLYSCKSENRDQVVEYLLNKYFIETNYKQTTVYNGIYDGYFTNLLKLQSNTIRKLLEMGTPLLFNQFSIPFPESIPTSQNDYIKFIEFFKSLLVIFSVEKNDILYLIILKKLNQLLDGSGNYHGNNVYSIKKNDLITDKHHQQFQVLSGGNGGIVKSIKSFLKNDEPIISRTLNPIVYKDYDVIREIDRMYTFDFLKTAIKNDKTNTWIIKVFDFMVRYNEFSIMDTLDQNSFYCLNYTELLKISLKSGNSEILTIISNLSKQHVTNKTLPFFNVITIRLDKTKLFDLKNVTVQQQIQYLKSLVANPIVLKHSYEILKIVLFHLFSNSNNLKQFSNQDFNEIGNVIYEWKRITYSQPLELYDIFNLDEHTITQVTVNTIIYFYSNLHEDLFNWEYNPIIKSCNTQLISYFYANVPGYNSQSILHNCTNLQIAKFVSDKCSTSFENGCLVYYSGLDDWESGYLWYNAFNWLIENNENNQPIKINVFELTINQIIYIHSKLNQGILNESNLILSDLMPTLQYDDFEGVLSTPKEIIPPSKLFSKTIYDINYIILHRNDNFIYSFIQSYENDTISNQLLYNKIMNNDSIDLLKLSFNNTKLLNLINNL